MKIKWLTSLITILVLIFFSCKKENNPPIITNQTFEVDENNADGILIGKVAASDPDGDELTFELITDEKKTFEIDFTTGNLYVKKGIILDYETIQEYTLLIKVTDNKKNALTNFATIKVAIKDLSEIPSNGMIAYYPFNNNATDESTNTYDGNVVGPTITEDRKEKTNSAYSFDGNNDYIDLGPMVGDGIRSISLWFRLDRTIDTSLNRNIALISREGDYNNYFEFSLAFFPSGLGGTGTPGKLRFLYSINKDIYFDVQSNNTSWQKDRWYHIVAIIHPTEGMKMYVDNVKQTDTEGYYNATENCQLNTYIGSWGVLPNRYFTGKIDDVIFYNRALTESEVNELFRQ
jgi:hypothetical protein